MAPLTAGGINPAFLKLLADERLAGLTVLDVGTGRGRLALALAPRCDRVIGIDRDESALAAARQAAAAAGLRNVEFVAVDAEAGEYLGFAPDVVAAHLCMSTAIAERAGRALAAAASALHERCLREVRRARLVGCGGRGDPAAGQLTATAPRMTSGSTAGANRMPT